MNFLFCLDDPYLKLFILFGWGRNFLNVACLTGVLLLQIFSDVVWRQVLSIRRAAYCICESSFLIHLGRYHDLFVCP